MGGHERLELTEELVLPPQRQVRGDAGLQRHQPQLVEPGSLGLSEARGVQVLQDLTAPQTQRVPQRARGAARGVVLPHRVDETIDGDDLAGMKEQHRQQPPRLEAPELERPRAHGGLERSKDPELGLHHSLCRLRRGRAGNEADAAPPRRFTELQRPPGTIVLVQANRGQQEEPDEHRPEPHHPAPVLRGLQPA